MLKIKAFLRSENGMETLEYAVIAALVGVVAVLVYTSGWDVALTGKLINAAQATTGS
jgi:Flp pilus assembly pilin Flp